MGPGTGGSGSTHPRRGITLADALDRVLDRGIVFDSSVRVSPAGIDLITVNAHVVVASIETYLEAGGRACPECSAPLRATDLAAARWDGWRHPDLLCVNGCHLPWVLRAEWAAAFAAGDADLQRQIEAKLT